MIDKPTILYITKFSDNQKIIDALCEKYEIIICNSPSNCLDLLLKSNIYAILVDDQDLNIAFSIVDIRDSLKNKVIPVLVMATFISNEDKVKLLNSNLVDYLDGDADEMLVTTKISLLVSLQTKATNDNFEYLYEHDPITNLYNNHGFFVHSNAFIDNNLEKELALVIIEIGKFDLYYTYNGEELSLNLLKQLACQVQSYFLSSDQGVLSRFNPNKFVAIIPYAEIQVQRAAREIKELVSNYDSNYYLLTKICINKFNGKTSSLETLFNLSTMTLESFNATSNNFIVYYTEDLKKKAMDEQEIINRMQKGIDEHEFQVYLQPKYISDLEKPFGAEALVRWIHPEKGLINPGSFIPLFEANGSIAKIDLYVWEQVCILLRKWIDSGKNPAPISVNMSRLDAYNIDVVNELISLVKKYNVPVKLLHIEVTESAYVEDFQSLISTVKKLKEFGFKIYVDDFGTGYTSLQTLNNVSIDVIKLDQSLLINNDLRGKCIINELVQLAKSLNIKTVMEGVENCEQASFFKEIGCDYIQGYYFARPMPVNEYEILIENFENMEYYHKYNLSN